jgi:hypothetical protein
VEVERDPQELVQLLRIVGQDFCSLDHRSKPGQVLGIDPHQWQVQVPAQILERARVFVKNAVLSDEELRGAWFEPVHDVGATVRVLLHEVGPGARLAVLPEGPQTVPYVRQRLAGVV